MTSMALGMTSLPMPSPGMTAMHLFGTGTKIAEAPPDAASTASADMDASAWVAITTAHLINLYDSYQGTTLVVPNWRRKGRGFSPGTRNQLRQGLKPKFIVDRAAARLKPCPEQIADLVVGAVEKK